MGFIKVQKNKAYFKRYQVKFRRRREARTDYYARKRLVLQDKNKFSSPKFRLVVRFSNRDVIAQIVSTDLDHDVVLASAYAHELRRYGITVGLTNYPSTYCTGLLLARRVNKKFGLADLYQGKVDVNGEDYNVTEDAGEDGLGKAPFKALLDVGLARTTTGARLFACLKGATDGGLDIPHTDRRFPGSKANEGAGAQAKHTPKPEVHRQYIFGHHISAYMKLLKETDDDKYIAQFKRFIDAGVTPEAVEGIYKNAHKAIRADPTKARDAKELGNGKVREKPKEIVKKRFNPAKLSVQQRKACVAIKIRGMRQKAAKAVTT